MAADLSDGQRLDDLMHARPLSGFLHFPKKPFVAKAAGCDLSTVQVVVHTYRLQFCLGSHPIQLVPITCGFRHSRPPGFSRPPRSSPSVLVGTLAAKKLLFSNGRCERLLGTLLGEKPFVINKRLASERFRFTPRTCRPLCGRLSVRKTDGGAKARRNPMSDMQRRGF